MNNFIVDVKKSNYVKEILPAGSYQGVCYKIIDIGTQYSSVYDNRNRKIRIYWELPTEMRVFDKDKGEQPVSVNKEYTLSFGEKSNLTKDLRSWRGHELTEEEKKTGFDLAKLIGKNCLLSIGVVDGRDGNKYNVVNSISGLLNGMEEKKPQNKTICWTITNGRDEVFETFPDFLKKKIFDSEERTKSNAYQNNSLDDLPF